MDYGIIRKPDHLTPEAKEIFNSYQNKIKEIENAHRKNMFRIGLGATMQGVSALPVFNIPYVGTGIGGALFDAGGAIMEGASGKDIAKKAGEGFIIGETVGAIPYAGKYANKLSGGKIGNALTAGVEKLASTPLGQKVTEIAPKVEDLLMTDIKAFNPNRQTVYHGSPYDFAKFSNEAIGTGEGAQAHGYGHYAAKNKDVAENYRNALSPGNYEIEYNGKVYKKNVNFKPKEYNYKILADVKQEGLEATRKHYKEDLEWAKEKLKGTPPNHRKWWEDYIEEAENRNNLLDTINPDKISEIRPDKGQLYKLSIPKDDVMLREDLGIWEQPQKVQDAILKLSKELNEKYPGNRFVNDFDNIIFNGNGKDLYKTLWHHNIAEQGELLNINEELNAWKLSAQDLSKHGIKGISYNGGIDGEANVIFNPDDIEIVRKYYNQPSLGEMLLKKSPNAGATSNYLYDLMIRE